MRAWLSGRARVRPPFAAGRTVQDPSAVNSDQLGTVTVQGNPTVYLKHSFVPALPGC